MIKILLKYYDYIVDGYCWKLCYNLLHLLHSGMLEYGYTRVLSTGLWSIYWWLQWWRVLPSTFEDTRSQIYDRDCCPELWRYSSHNHKRCLTPVQTEHLLAPSWKFYYGLSLLARVELVSLSLNCGLECGSYQLSSMQSCWISITVQVSVLSGVRVEQ